MMTQAFHLEDRLLSIKRITNQEKLIVEVLKIFSEMCQITEACFFRYSPIGFLGEGIISLEQGRVKHIPELRYDIRTLPTIEAAIVERKAKYYEGQEIFEQTGSNYIIESTVDSFLVTPLFSGTNVLGFIYGLNKQKETAPYFLEDITKFSEHVGNILQSFSPTGKQSLLSNRELEVMKEIAWGATTKEIAGLLGISEATVKQYVKFAVKKLNASNRAHAVAELMRKGQIL